MQEYGLAVEVEDASVTRAPTSSCSAAGPTPSARSWSRPGRADSPAWRSTREAPHRSSSTARPDGSANPTPACWRPRSASSPIRRRGGRSSAARARGRPRAHLGGRDERARGRLRPGHRAGGPASHQAGQSGLERPSKVCGVTDELAQRTQRIERAGRGRRRRRSRPRRSRTSASEPDLTDPSLYFNRELSWLDFNDRVLELAEDPTRAAARAGQASARSTRPTSTSSSWSGSPGCYDQVDAGIDARGPDGLAPGRADRRDPAARRSSCDAPPARAASTASCARRSPSTGSGSSRSTGATEAERARDRRAASTSRSSRR